VLRRDPSNVVARQNLRNLMGAAPATTPPISVQSAPGP
jgi:hypothetical protein